jgi:hypothetical protein
MRPGKVLAEQQNVRRLSSPLMRPLHQKKLAPGMADVAAETTEVEARPRCGHR